MLGVRWWHDTLPTPSGVDAETKSHQGCFQEAASWRGGLSTVPLRPRPPPPTPGRRDCSECPRQVTPGGQRRFADVSHTRCSWFRGPGTTGEEPCLFLFLMFQQI